MHQSSAGPARRRGPVSQRFWGPAMGAGFALTFLPKQARSPKTRPHPSPSWKAVSSSAAAGWSLGPFPLSSLFRSVPEPARGFPKHPNPKQRRSPSLRTYPTPPFIRHCSLREQRWEAGSPSASIQPGIRDSDLRELGLRLCVGQSHRWGTRDGRARSGFQICSVSGA